MLVCWSGCSAPSQNDAGAAGGSAAGGSANAGGSGGSGGGSTFVVLDGGGPVALTTACPSLAMPAGAANVYVDSAAVAAGMGTLAAPFRTVAEALAAAGDGGVIWVAGGTYRERLTVPDKGLRVLGGFTTSFTSRVDGCATALEAPAAQDTVITIPIDVQRFALDGVTVRNAARGLFYEGDSSNLGTLTVTSSVFRDNGRASTLEDAIGGGALVTDVDATFLRCVFRDNQGAKGGAIAYASATGSITLDRCVFDGNSAHSDHGGGVYVTARQATVTRSTFRRNEVGRQTNGGWGGGFLVFKADDVSPAHADLAYNVFTENIATQGAAVFVDDGATATMSHDLLYRNRSILENGVGVAQALLVDGLADGNAARGSRLTADHLTIANNALDRTGAPAAMNRGGAIAVMQAASATLTNSVLWNNGPDELRADPGCSLAVSASIAQSACVGGGTCTFGAGVIQPAMAHFASEAADDYHEKSTAGRYSAGAWVSDAVTSPIVDAVAPSASFANESAPNGGRANLGAFGNTLEASRSP